MINLTQPLKKKQVSEFFPLLYYIVIFFSDAPSPVLTSWGNEMKFTEKIEKDLI